MSRLVLARRAGGRAFARDERGVTVVEFGLLALPFFAVIGAILQTSLVFFAGQVLDTALESSARLIRTGQAQSGSFTASNFKTTICDQLYGMFGDCSGVNVKVTIITDFQHAAATPPVFANGHWTEPTPCFQPGAGNQVIMVQAYYKWPLLMASDFLHLQTASDGTHLLSSVRVFSNEPFGGSPVASTC